MPYRCHPMRTWCVLLSDLPGYGSSAGDKRRVLRMTFIWPAMLVTLLCIPLLIALYSFLQRRRQRIAASYDSFAGGQIKTHQPGRRRHIPPLLFLVALTLLSIALARPQMTVNLP